MIWLWSLLALFLSGHWLMDLDRKWFYYESSTLHVPLFFLILSLFRFPLGIIILLIFLMSFLIQAYSKRKTHKDVMVDLLSNHCRFCILLAFHTSGVPLCTLHPCSSSSSFSLFTIMPGSLTGAISLHSVTWGIFST